MSNFPVLVYHRVAENGEGESSDFIVNSWTFERQLSFFRDKGYYTPALKDILNGAVDRGSKKKPFLITFDDGYQDTLEIAAPLLRKFEFNAIVFIIPNFSLCTNSWDAEIGSLEARLMGREQVLALRAMGFEIGAHSWSHTSLPTLDDAELDIELRKCKTEAEKLLQEPVISFAYPYGDVNERVMTAAQKAGYSCAFATNSGPMSFHKSLFRVRRTRIGNSSNRLYLFLKVSGIEKAFRVARSRLRGIIRRISLTLRGGDRSRVRMFR
jgi:peptidoglycan/xylan/chitin deacetylase (PgdA/CDA1 family)